MPTDVSYFVRLDYPHSFDESSEVTIATTDAAFLKRILDQLDMTGVQSTITMTLRGNQSDLGLKLMQQFGHQMQVEVKVMDENSPDK